VRAIFLSIILAAFVGAVTYLSYSRDLSNARARLAGRSRAMETSAGAVEYALLGKGGAVLAIHGAGGGFDQALDIVGELAEQGYHVIAPSRFGYLRSAMPSSPTPAKQADAFVELLDGLGVKKAFAISISAGAWSALQFAIRHPDRCLGLVLLVPANHLPPNTRNHGGSFVRAIAASDFTAWAALKLMPLMPGPMTKLMLGSDPDLVRIAVPAEKERLKQTLDHLLPISSRFEGMQFDIRTAATAEPYPLEKMACPTLAVSAEDDSFGTAVRAKEIAKGVSNGKALIFPTGGHALVGHYADVLAEVTKFLASLPYDSSVRQTSAEEKPQLLHPPRSRGQI
jgi:2-hydroxy-6-oxonona-2,4-dienedioate hydrolase